MAKRKRQKRNQSKRVVTNQSARANRKYKDTIFRMLFKDKKNLLSLYNAMNKKSYTNPDALEVVTLDNAIYMGITPNWWSIARH